MSHIEYFKRQAKNLFKDYKTKKPYIEESDGYTYYEYEPKFFDIDRIFVDFDWPEEDFTLMKAQHFIAMLTGFRKWNDLIRASEKELELARLLFDNQDKLYLEDWEMYIAGAEAQNDTSFSTEEKIEIFQKVYLNGGDFDNPFGDYRIKKAD